MKNETSLVAFDKNTKAVNIHICSDARAWWLVGYKGDKLYVQGVYFTDPDESKEERHKYANLVDYTELYLTKKGAIEAAEAIQDLIDSGMSAKDAYTEYCEAQKAKIEND